MGYMIEIKENKVGEMSELVEEMLSCGGKLMSCLERIGGKSRMGRRNPMPDYRNDWEDDEEYGDRHDRRRGQYRY